jgi:hypothetical protein
VVARSGARKLWYATFVCGALLILDIGFTGGGLSSGTAPELAAFGFFSALALTGLTPILFTAAVLATVIRLFSRSGS